LPKSMKYASRHTMVNVTYVV